MLPMETLVLMDQKENWMTKKNILNHANLKHQRFWDLFGLGKFLRLHRLKLKSVRSLCLVS